MVKKTNRIAPPIKFIKLKGRTKHHTSFWIFSYAVTAERKSIAAITQNFDVIVFIRPVNQKMQGNF